MAHRSLLPKGEAFVEVDGGRLSYLDVGAGPALVFIHGWPLNKEVFLPLIARLEHSFRCIAFDLLDTGNSRLIDKGTQLSFPRHATTILAALAKIGVERFRLVGQDSGGFIARLMAIEATDRVEQLVLFNTELPNHIPPWLQMFQALAKFPRLAKLAFRTSLSVRLLAKGPMAFGGCFFDKSHIFGDFFNDCALPLLQDDEKLSGTMRFLDQMDWSTRFTIEQMHHAIKSRTHFIWGEKDKFFPLDLAKLAFQQFPNRGDFIIVEDTKLLFFHEKPDLVSKHMLRLLSADCKRCPEPNLGG